MTRCWGAEKNKGPVMPGLCSMETLQQDAFIDPIPTPSDRSKSHRQYGGFEVLSPKLAICPLTQFGRGTSLNP